MDNAHSDAAAQLIKRVAERSRSSGQPEPQGTAQIEKLVINRADNCTFIFNASPGQVERVLRSRERKQKGTE